MNAAGRRLAAPAALALATACGAAAAGGGWIRSTPGAGGAFTQVSATGDTVWVAGDISGFYRSLDGGKSWTNIGLKDTRHIGALVVHPRNPDIAYVAALGHAYGPNPDRGVYRTLDGGKTWDKVLFKDNNTGAIDIVLDPHNPNVLVDGLSSYHLSSYHRRLRPLWIQPGRAH